jgi:hypothetical protein
MVTAAMSRSVVARVMPGADVIVFIPEHMMLWEKFPVWYHLTFLLSLVPLTYAGGRIAWDVLRVHALWRSPTAESARRFRNSAVRC